MVQLQLQIERTTPGLYRWLLPRDNASATQLNIFHAMTRHAMTVTNAQLKKIMNMELSTTASRPTREGHHFYVRTWTFKIEDLKSLLGHFRQDDTYFTELKEWAQEIQASETCGMQILTVRKWGTCKGPERPIDRHMDDLKQWSSGIFGEFLNITEAWAPEVAADAEIFLLPDAFVLIDKVSQLFAEDTEHLLTQFGHFPTTLNRQPGGFYSSFLPDAEDVRAFRQMDTNVLHRLSQYQNEFPRISADELAAHFEDVQFYANEFPDETGTSSRHFSDSLRKMMLRQGTLTQFHGHTLMLCIGKDITRTDYLAEASFMSGDSSDSDQSTRATDCSIQPSISTGLCLLIDCNPFQIQAIGCN